jgi:hypothetical protein
VLYVTAVLRLAVLCCGVTNGCCCCCLLCLSYYVYLSYSVCHRTYSADIVNNLVDPSMGQPLASEEQIRELQDTSTWAFDPATGEEEGE